MKPPKPLALIYKDYCTGCEACIQMCPIKDCIVRNPEGEGPSGSWVYVVPQKCIGWGVMLVDIVASLLDPRQVHAKAAS